MAAPRPELLPTLGPITVIDREGVAHTDPVSRDVERIRALRGGLRPGEQSVAEFWVHIHSPSIVRATP